MKRKNMTVCNKWFIVLMLVPAFAFVLIFTYFPLFKGVVMAFQNYSLFNLSKVEWIGFDNFKELFTPSAGNSFYSTMGNTVKWVLVSLFFQFAIGFSLAMMLRKKFWGRGMYQGVIFFPWAVSGFIIEPYGFLSNMSSALNSVIVANIWYGIPFFTLMINAALQGVPQDLYEAASVDGASPLRKFFNITLPYIKPVLELTVLLRVIWIFNFPELIYSMTNGGPGGSSHIITSYMMEKVRSLDYGMGSAIGVVVILMLSIYTIIYLKVAHFDELEES